MFNKKKSEPVMGWADSKMHDLYNEWSKLFDTLWSKAEQTYIKAEVLKVYDLTEPDGENIQKDLEAAKHSLLCSIRQYDHTITEIKRHYAEHHEEMQTNWNINFHTGREQVEFAIREILRGN